MRIKELQLISFGKFSDYNIEVDDGLNIIYGVNEAGKSTVLLFIKVMLFGFPKKRGKTGELKDRERVIPWDKTKASGRMVVNFEGRDIEIYREFGKTARGDKIRVIDKNTGEDVFKNPADSESLGEQLCGMGVNMFERTVWIAQNDTYISGKDDEIAERLMNLLESGSASDISVDNALNSLDEKMKSLKSKTARSRPGIIDMLIKHRDELIQKRIQVRQAEEDRRQKKQQLNQLQAQQVNTEHEIQKWKNASKRVFMRNKVQRVSQLEKYLADIKLLSESPEYKLFSENYSDEINNQINNNDSAVRSNKDEIYAKRMAVTDELSENFNKQNQVQKRLTKLEQMSVDIDREMQEHQRQKELEKQTKSKHEGPSGGIMLGIIGALVIILGFVGFALELNTITSCIIAVVSFLIGMFLISWKFINKALHAQNHEISSNRDESDSDFNQKDYTDKRDRILDEIKELSDELVQLTNKHDEIDKKQRQIEEINHKISELEKNMIDQLSLFGCKTYEEYQDKLVLYSNIKNKIDMYQNMYKNGVGEEDFSELKIEAQELKKKLNELEPPDGSDPEVILSQLESQMTEITEKIFHVKNNLDNTEQVLESDIVDEVDGVASQIIEARKEYDASVLASETLNQVYTRIKSDYTPYLNRETEKFLKRLTDGNHENLKIADDFSLNLSQSGYLGDVKRAEFFSMGTYNQIYLSLRLAIAKLTLNPLTTVLYLDDALMTYDDNRALNAIELLRALCSESGFQCVMFTCHNRDIDLANAYHDIKIIK